MKNKTLVPAKLRIDHIVDYDNTGPFICSGCGTQNLNGGEQIWGHLKGSGARPFLILCPECTTDMVERLTK